MRTVFFLTLLLLGIELISNLAYSDDSFTGVKINSDPSNSKLRPIKLGFLSDTSGPGAYWGKQSTAGARLALKELLPELNARGVAPEIIFESHNVNTGQAVSAAQKLLTVDKVDLFYSEFSPPTVAVSPLLKNNRAFLLYVAASMSVVRTNPYSVKSFLDYERGCKALLPELLTSPEARLGMLSINIEAGELCRKGVLGSGTPSVGIDYDIGNEVASQVINLKSKRVTAILNAGLEGDIERMLIALNRYSFRPILGVNEDAFSPALRKRYPEFTESVFTYGLKEPNRKLVAEVEEFLPPEEFTSPTAVGLAYLHTKQLLRIAAACPNRDSICYLQELDRSPPEPAFGFHGFSDRLAKNEIHIKRFEQGELVVHRVIDP